MYLSRKINILKAHDALIYILYFDAFLKSLYNYSFFFVCISEYNCVFHLKENKKNVNTSWKTKLRQDLTLDLEYLAFTIPKVSVTKTPCETRKKLKIEK